MLVNSIKKMYFYGIIFLVLIISNILVSCNKFTNSHVDVDSNKKIELTINYILPNYVYNNKDELFNDFYLDFYNYINTCSGGSAHLKRYDIESVDDLYDICRGFDKKSATGFPLVGDILAPYFLYQRRKSNFEEQKNKDFFVGHCLRNNKYIKFLYFLEKFFYHFRMDEGYTGPESEGKHPYGSDFFASSYASIIDTTKFFYYTKDTLPVFFYDTKNIPDLYDKIPGILTTPFDKNITISYDISSNNRFSLPTNLDCYAYQFIGWYTDPNFTSEPLTHINNTFITNNKIDENNNTITLYAKFIDKS